MHVQVEKTGPYLCKLSVTVPAGDVDSAFDDVFRKLTKSANLPGFRPGKVPRSLVEKRFAKEAQSEVQNRLVETTLGQALDDNEVTPVSRPMVDYGDLSRGGDFSYTAEVEVRPEIQLKKYKGLGVPKTDTSVSEEELEGELEKLRERSVQLVPVLTRDVVQAGDVVQMDYEGTMGGIPFEGGSAENAMMEIGPEGFIPGVAGQLEGARVPGERVVHVDFPQDYPAEHLAGKPATLKISLKELKSKELPQVDDDFAQDLGEESLAELRKKVREGLAKRKDDEADAMVRRAIMRELVDENPLDVPPSMVREQADRMVSSAAMRLQSMMRERLDLNGLDLSSLREQSMDEARRHVAGALLLIEVAKVEELEVDDAAVEAEVSRLVEETDENGARARAYYDSAEGRDGVRYRILEDKVMEHLIEQAVEREMTPEDRGEKPTAEGADDDEAHSDGTQGGATPGAEPPTTDGGHAEPAAADKNEG